MLTNSLKFVVNVATHPYFLIPILSISFRVVKNFVATDSIGDY